MECHCTVWRADDASGNERVVAVLDLQRHADGAVALSRDLALREVANLVRREFADGERPRAGPPVCVEALPEPSSERAGEVIRVLCLALERVGARDCAGELAVCLASRDVRRGEVESPEADGDDEDDGEEGGDHCRAPLARDSVSDAGSHDVVTPQMSAVRESTTSRVQCPTFGVYESKAINNTSKIDFFSDLIFSESCE